MATLLPPHLLDAADPTAALAWLETKRPSVDLLLQVARHPDTALLTPLWRRSSARVRSDAVKRCVEEGDPVTRDRLLNLGGPDLHRGLAEWGARQVHLDLLHLAIDGTLPAWCLNAAANRQQWAYLQALTQRVDVRPAFQCLTRDGQARVFNHLISAPGLAPLVQQLMDVAKPAAWADACRACTNRSRPNADTIRCLMTHPQAPAESLAGALMGLARDEPGFLPLLREMGQKLATSGLWKHVPDVRMIPESSRLEHLDWVGTVAPAAVREDWLAQWGDALPRSRQVAQAGQRQIRGMDQTPTGRRRRPRT